MQSMHKHIQLVCRSQTHTQHQTLLTVNLKVDKPIAIILGFPYRRERYAV